MCCIGVYVVTLFTNNGEVSILLDDYLPVDASHRPVFAKARPSGVLWVSLLEKVYIYIYIFITNICDYFLHNFSFWLIQ